MENKRKNNLGTEPISKLLNNFAIPSIIAMLVSALYNIVNQFLLEEVSVSLEMLN